MEFTCPSSGKPSIKVHHKLGASVIGRAVWCPGCGAPLLIRIHPLLALVHGFVAHVAIFGGAIVALWYSSWWPLILGVLSTWVLVPAVLGSLSPLVVVPEGEVDRTRHRRRMRIGALILLVVAFAFALRPLLSAILLGDL